MTVEVELPYVGKQTVTRDGAHEMAQKLAALLEQGFGTDDKDMKNRAEARTFAAVLYAYTSQCNLQAIRQNTK